MIIIYFDSLIELLDDFYNFANKIMDSHDLSRTSLEVDFQ